MKIQVIDKGEEVKGISLTEYFTGKAVTTVIFGLVTYTFKNDFLHVSERREA